MQHYSKSGANIQDFYDFVRAYEKAKRENGDLMFFGLTSIFCETLDEEYEGDFQSRRLKCEEDMGFDGKVYADLTEDIDDIIDEWEEFDTDHERQEYLKERIQEDCCPVFYAAIRYYSLKREYEQHDYIDEFRFDLSKFSSLHFGTNKEMENYIEERFDPKKISYSSNYTTYQQIKKELEEAKEETHVYSFSGFNEYHEKAYFSAKTNQYYMVAEGGPSSKIGINDGDNTYRGGGFSRFTEKEFADYIDKKFKEQEIEKAGEINTTEAFHTLVKRYRLRLLFKEK